MKNKFEKFPMLQFERSYPPTKKMIEEGSSNFKKMWKFKEANKDNEWKQDWHMALIHYIECNDYDLYTPENMRSGEKMTKDEKKKKRECNDKLTLKNSVIKQIKKIPYGPYRYNDLVAPGESDDDQSDENETKNEKGWDCWSKNIKKK